MTGQSLEAVDIARWRAKYALIKAVAETHSDTVAEWTEVDNHDKERVAEVRVLLDEFVDGGSLETFRNGLDAWSRRPGPFTAFNGFGSLWLKQVHNYAGEHLDGVTQALRAAVQTPATEEEAVSQLAALEMALDPIRRSGQPTAGRKAFVLSLFWSTDPADRSWPCMWPSAGDTLRQLGWASSWNHDELYPTFRAISSALEPDNPRIVQRYLWFLDKRKRFVGLSQDLVNICSDAADLLHGHVRHGGYESDADAERAAELVRQLKGELSLAGEGLLDRLSVATARELKLTLPQSKTSYDASKPYRADMYCSWSLPGGMEAPSIRLWATRSGLAYGAHAGWRTYDELSAMLARVDEVKVPEQVYFHVLPHDTGDRLARRSATFEKGEVFVGWWWEGDSALGSVSLETDLIEKGRQLGLLLEIFEEFGRATTSPPDKDVPAYAIETSEALRTQADAFRRQRPYPNDKDAWQQETREVFADCLSSEGLSDLDLDTFRRMYNGSGYGAPGPQAALNRSINQMTGEDFARFCDELREFLWGDERVERRIERAFEREILDVRGLGASVLMKMMAVTHPDRFLPVFPLVGDSGKLAMLDKLGLELSLDGPESARHIEANDILRQLFEPLFPGDPWGQAQFGYWLLNESSRRSAPEVDRIAAVAEELLVDAAFLEEMESLLQDKKQVIFYGPPGTGKTYIAKKFAAAIQPDPSRRKIVQFHPSTSYEDFFEGFRPRLDASGQLTYELRKGPLALLVEKAEEARNLTHVLLIDEINRANLPRVLGELLFLLEYRGESVFTTYRPDAPFELPPNLWIIGTMNTADRSIAMVDAALRRRFHFVPFMPHEEPLSGVLARWLAKTKGPAWLVPLLREVNGRLVEILGGPHLQVGHSHFMVEKLDDKELQRIWTYGVYPMIEDQLYGRNAVLESFTWQAVVKDFGPGSSRVSELELELEMAESDDEADRAH